MRLFPHLWQRVFMYAIFLVFASHLVSFAVFRFGIEENMHTRLLENLVSNGAAALEGKPKEAANILSDFFRNFSRMLWIERADGELIAGTVEPGFSYDERQRLPLVHTLRNNVRFMKTGNPDAPYLAAVPVNLLDGDATLYISIEKSPPPPMPVLFVQGLTAVCLIGGPLSVWAAWRISRPLRRLRSEVLAIADGDLDARVSVEGSEEIAQVAEAVNSMAQNLSDNITGMRELVANISHEMRSPLTRMSFSTAIVEEGLRALVHRHAKHPPSDDDDALPVILDAEGSPLAVRHMHRMAQEIEYMESLVGSCLLNSKLDLRQETPRMEALDLSLLCKKALAKHEGLLQAKQLSCRQSVQENLWVNGDEELLSLVLTNLLDNAVKYTAEGGLVRLRLCREADGAALRLENSQEAIDRADLSRLFEPFFRGRNTAGSSSGIGLGLSLVSKIVACHQGSVTAENGTCGLLFTVRLPCVQAAVPEFERWFFERHS